MVTPELLDYVKGERAYHVAKNAIVDALLGVGWMRIDVDETFALLDTREVADGTGVHKDPEFLSHTSDDGTTIVEETIVNSKTETVTAPLKVRFPEAISVMPQPVSSLVGTKLEMRPAEDDGIKKGHPALRGLLYAVIILVIVGVVALITMHFLGIQNPISLIRLKTSP